MDSLKILVVDDNVDGANTIRSLFEAIGHIARAAYSGSQAIQVARELSPHFVLLDIGLPDQDGWEVTKVIRQDDTLVETKIYALSGYGEPTDFQRSMEAGMNYHFVKPLDMKELWRVAKLQGVINE